MQLPVISYFSFHWIWKVLLFQFHNRSPTPPPRLALGTLGLYFWYFGLTLIMHIIWLNTYKASYSLLTILAFSCILQMKPLSSCVCVYIYIYIYMYCHPQTDCFIVSQLLGSKPQFFRQELPFRWHTSIQEL